MKNNLYISENGYRKIRKMITVEHTPLDFEKLAKENNLHFLMDDMRDCYLSLTEDDDCFKKSKVVVD